MDTKSINPIIIKTEVGKKVDREALQEEYGVKKKDNFLNKIIKKANKLSKIEPLFKDKSIKTALKQGEIYDAIKQKELFFTKEKFPKLHEFASRIPQNVVGIVDKGKLKLFKKHYDNNDKEIMLSGINQHDTTEFADLTALYDTVPKDQLYSGDRLYIINGKLISAWSIYYGRNAISSPEDYGKNIDLIWNIPYLFGSFELKAQMGLGAPYRISDGQNTQDSEEEKWVKWLLNNKLNINDEYRKKCSFHEDSYGNYYQHIHRDSEGIADKLTILQPERMKVYLDPLTTKVLFYVYLPPIMGGTIMETYPSARGLGPATMAMQNSPVLRFPVPIVISVNDIIHVTEHKYTEYPFGFSCCKPLLDVAQTRLDCNIMVPYYFKKYIKPTIHWSYNDEGIGKKIKPQLNAMETKLESAEPGSDLITTHRWKGEVIQAKQGQSEIYAMLNDCDNQMFACTRVPETYFKAKGTTDRMVSNEDKTFLGSLKQRQNKFADAIFKKIIIPSVNIKFGEQKLNNDLVAETADTYNMVENKGVGSQPLTAIDVSNDPVYNSDEPLIEYENFYEMNYPRMEFEDITKTDITQEIANVNAMLNNELITHERAAQKLGEKFDPTLKSYLDKKQDLEIEQMESGIKQENEYQSSTFTEQKGGGDMNKDERTSELANPEGKFKRAENKLSKADGDGTEKPKGQKPKKSEKKTETADNFKKIM